jgi:hypothetical protein
MKLLEIYNLYLSIQFKADDAIQEHNNSNEYTNEEKQWNEQHWLGVKLGAETLYKKIQELNKESVSL